MVCTATRKGTNLVAETMLKTMANTPSDAETNLVAEPMSSGGSDGGSKRRLLLLSPLFLLFLCLSLFFFCFFCFFSQYRAVIYYGEGGSSWQWL
jgi:hypothetical protein